jgi:membrane fusion protein (multidrug efflux system)
MWVRFTVSGGQLFFIGTKHAPVRETPRLELILADNSVFPQTGEVATTLGALELQAEFPNPQHRLHPGQFVRVRYPTGHRTDVIVVPRRAVQQSQGITTVFVVGKGNRIQQPTVTTSAAIGDAWVVEKGLQAGDRVVLDRLPALRPGMVRTI